MGSKNTGLNGKETQAKTRLLLALWDLGGTQQEIKKGQLTKRILSKGLKVADYQDLFAELQKQGAIAISKQGYSLTSPKGVDLLGEDLRSGAFKFEGTIVGTWAANALVKWISESDIAATSTFTPVNQKSAIVSYEEFKSQVFDLFEKLDKSYNYSGLVPIWQIRQELGNQIQRDQFSNWIMEMQAEHLLYLQSGEARGATEKQKRDSINSDIRGLLFFASKPL